MVQTPVKKLTFEEFLEQYPDEAEIEEKPKNNRFDINQESSPLDDLQQQLNEGKN